MSTRALPLAIVLALQTAGTAPLHGAPAGQTSGSTSGQAVARTPVEAMRDLRLDVVDSTAVVVATTLALPSGASDDPDGLEGLTHTVAEAHRIGLRGIPGVLEVETTVTRWATTWTVLSTPDAASRVLRDIEAPEVMLGGLTLAIDQARRRFAFTAATPAAEVDLEAARLFAGFGSPWARPVRGSPETVAAIGSRAARERWEELLDGERALVRVGPPDAVGPTVTTPNPGGAPAVSPSNGPAWTTEDRRTITREVTNVWIVAAFPLPADLDRTSLDHLVHRIEEILNPTPGDPGLIGAGVEPARLPAGPVLIVRATVLPSSAARWEERIRSIPSGITPPFDPEFFRWERRRFRAHLLLGDAPPGARSRRIAHDLLATGSVRSLAEAAWALEPDDLANAAARLGPPRILLFGPAPEMPSP